MAWSTAAVEGWVLAAVAAAGGLVVWTGAMLCWGTVLAGVALAGATVAAALAGATVAGVDVLAGEVACTVTAVDVGVLTALGVLARGDVVDAWAVAGATFFAAGLCVATAVVAVVARAAAAVVASVWMPDGWGGSRSTTPATTATPREPAAPVANHLR